MRAAAEFLPEIKDSPLPDKESFLRADYMTRLFGLFALSDRCGDDFCSAMKRLKTDSATAEDGRAVLNALNEFEINSARDAGRLLYVIGKERALLTAKVGELIGKYESYSIDLVSRYIDSGKPYKLSELAVSGDDLKKVGLGGREIGEALKTLMTKVIDGELGNSKEILLSYVKK